MTTSQIEYQGSFRARATHLQSGNSIRTDAPVDNQGKGEDFSPTDLLATSLGACMITIMGIEANKMGINIDNTRISVTKHMSSDLPRRVSGVDIIMKIPHTLSEEYLIALRQFADNCPVAKSIHPDMKVSLDISCE